MAMRVFEAYRALTQSDHESALEPRI
jgi:hypothetical protein